jgi:hypothetical protein
MGSLIFYTDERQTLAAAATCEIEYELTSELTF